jgi:hypothetical protein
VHDEGNGTLKKVGGGAHDKGEALKKKKKEGRIMRQCVEG